MSVWVVPPCPGLIEPAPAPEFFVEMIGGIELIGACVRLYGCATQLPLETSAHEPHRVVQVKIVRPLVTVPEAIIGMAHCLETAQRPEPVIGPFPRLVT